MENLVDLLLAIVLVVEKVTMLVGTSLSYAGGPKTAVGNPGLLYYGGGGGGGGGSGGTGATIIAAAKGGGANGYESPANTFYVGDGKWQCWPKSHI